MKRRGKRHPVVRTESIWVPGLFIRTEPSPVVILQRNGSCWPRSFLRLACSILLFYPALLEVRHQDIHPQNKGESSPNSLECQLSIWTTVEGTYTFPSVLNPQTSIVGSPSPPHGAQ